MLPLLSTEQIQKHSIHLGETVYYGNVDNKGVVMGNAYTPAKDGIRITGSTTVSALGSLEPDDADQI